MYSIFFSLDISAKYTVLTFSYVHIYLKFNIFVFPSILFFKLDNSKKKIFVLSDSVMNFELKITVFIKNKQILCKKANR